jgi:hypothetical protein
MRFFLLVGFSTQSQVGTMHHVVRQTKLDNLDLSSSPYKGGKS